MNDRMDIKSGGHDFLRGISKRRRQVLGGEDPLYFHISRKPENLAPEEYDKRLEAFKQQGNFC